MPMQSSASSFSYRFTYDVFLSFRGQHTRYGFTGHLYKALSDRGIHTFIDDQQLPRGDQITAALDKAIKGSRIFILVFSEDYASSSFCLNELACILNFIEGKDLLVLPVFYKVDPSDVRHHRGSFGKALANHEKRFKANKAILKGNMEKLQTWKMALSQAANLSGFHFKHWNEYEYEFIQKIVKLVCEKINGAPLNIVDCPVGLESQLQKVNLLTDVESNDVVKIAEIHELGEIAVEPSAEPDPKEDTEVFEAVKLAEHEYRRTEKHSSIVKQEEEEKKEEEDDKGGKKIEEEGEKNEKGGSGDEGEENNKEKKEADQGEAIIQEDSAGIEETTMAELKKRECYFMPPRFGMEFYAYRAQYVYPEQEQLHLIFNDENPNSCSIM